MEQENNKDKDETSYEKRYQEKILIFGLVNWLRREGSTWRWPWNKREVSWAGGLETHGIGLGPLTTKLTNVQQQLRLGPPLHRVIIRLNGWGARGRTTYYIDLIEDQSWSWPMSVWSSILILTMNCELGTTVSVFWLPNSGTKGELRLSHSKSCSPKVPHTWLKILNAFQLQFGSLVVGP